MSSFTDYERITDSLMYLSDRLTLNFVVNLAKKNQMGNRQFCHFETSYVSEKYNGTSPIRSIKRNMSYYFVIDDREVFANGFILRPQDVELLLMLIQQQILPWFFGNKEERAFHMVKEQLVLKEYREVVYTQSESRWIKFAPIVYSYEDGTFAQGLEMIFQSGEVASMNADKFMGFVNILKTDMYAVACSMLTYVKQQPYEINTYSPSGLGASRSPRQQDWQNNTNYKGNGTNSFLNNSKSKEASK